MTTTNQLGYGIICPFHFTSEQDFSCGGGRELVNSDLKQLVGIEQGEVAWRQGIGTRMNRLRHRSNSAALSSLARVDVGHAIALFEKRARLKSVQAEKFSGDKANQIALTINYEVASNTDKTKVVF